ncbi:gem-associated protein 6 [Sorex fumeus]|uniref:gem-associated protein 6 n=1 Tax=Sorex fumeus TaxID=62283 RepID=UPI0024AE226E|nr:gem-associated protein 6 [Sorex fumeus]
MGEWAGRSPLEWQAWTHRAVRVRAGEREYRGWLLATDPVSASVVLASFLEDGRLSVTGVMGHAIRAVAADPEQEGQDAGVRERLAPLFVAGAPEACSPELLRQRRDSLRKWLEENHVPIAELGDAPHALCVAGVLTIEPPYGPDNCSSANEIVLSRVQDLIQRHLAAS